MNKELKLILEKHKKYLNSEEGRADFRAYYLSGDDLSDSNLGGDKIIKIPEYIELVLLRDIYRLKENKEKTPISYVELRIKTLNDFLNNNEVEESNDFISTLESK